MRGARAFDNFSSIDLTVLSYLLSNFHGSFQSEFDVSVYHQRAAVTLMLVLQGFGRSDDLRRIRDYRQDEVKLYTEVNVYLLIPLFIVTGVLGIGIAVAAWSHPFRGMVLRIPVSIEQLMCALQARDAGAKFTFGPVKAELRMGIERISINHQERQKFSVDTSKTVPYNAEIPWV